MKRTLLDYHYNRLLTLYHKLQSRLNRSFAAGRFKEFSRHKQYRLLQRLRKLRIQLSALEQQFKYRGLALAATAGISFLPAASMAQPAPAGTEFQVNTYTPGVQMYQKIAMDTDGDFVVTWASRGQDDASEYGIFAQCYNALGVATTPEFQVNTYTSGRQNNPAIAMDDDGNFVIVWTSSGQDGSSGGVFAQRFLASGVPQGSEFQVNTYTTGNQYSPAVAMDSDGDFTITWSSSQDPQYGIFARQYDAAGGARGDEFQVNTYTTGVQRFSAIAMDDDGDFVITWQSDQDGSSYGIYGQRYDSEGAAQGSEFLVNTYTTGAQKNCSVAMDQDGDFVIAWQSTQDGSSDGIYAQRYNSAGVAQGNEFPVNTYTTGSQSFPSVAMNANGNFIISYATVGLNGDSDGGIGAQRYNAAGEAQGAEFMANTTIGGLQSAATVALDNDLDFVIAWTSEGQDGSSKGVYAQRYEENLAPVSLGLTDTSVDENATANTVIGTFATEDPDNNNTFTYAFASGTGDTDNASFTITGNELQIVDIPDFETKSSYSIRVRSTDQGGLSSEKVFTITVNDLTETSIADAAFSASIQLYPNPARGTVQISLEGPARVRISDLSGQLVREEMVNDRMLNIESIPAGIYMMEITWNNKTGMKKLVVE